MKSSKIVFFFEHSLESNYLENRATKYVKLTTMYKFVHRTAENLENFFSQAVFRKREKSWKNWIFLSTMILLIRWQNHLGTTISIYIRRIDNPLESVYTKEANYSSMCVSNRGKHQGENSPENLINPTSVEPHCTKFMSVNFHSHSIRETPEEDCPFYLS